MSDSRAPKLAVAIEDNQREALSKRVIELLERVGVAEAEVRPGGQRENMLFVWFPGNPKEPIERLRVLCESEPDRFRGTRQWTPIDGWTSADAQHIAAYAEDVARRTPEAETFQVEIHRGGHVDLEVDAMLPEHEARPPTPTRTLRIEIIGSRASVSVLEPGDELDVYEALRAKLAHDFFGEGTTRR